MLRLFKLFHNGTQKDACKECDYYHDSNNTCQLKKCSTNNPYVTRTDRMHCTYYRYTKKSEEFKGEEMEERK